jgi:hypothetical protein
VLNPFYKIGISALRKAEQQSCQSVNPENQGSDRPDSGVLK